MEMVHGVNLASFIAYEPALSIDRCIWILRQICGAIEEAHGIGLIHRDIKPQNVMICQKGQLADLVKVVDFGLAKTMADNVARDVTATRVLIGTPGFIAPERMETPWIADPRIDIFAFGVLGVFLLTSKVPMIGATNDSLMMTLQLGRFAPLCNDIDFRSLVLLLAQCISPDPSDRPKSMEDVGKKLEGISSHFPWNEDLAEKWWRANGDDLVAYARATENGQKNG
jgi:serine/threonine-protein kinase